MSNEYHSIRLAIEDRDVVALRAISELNLKKRADMATFTRLNKLGLIMVWRSKHVITEFGKKVLIQTAKQFEPITLVGGRVKTVWTKQTGKGGKPYYSQKEVSVKPAKVTKYVKGGVLQL